MRSLTEEQAKTLDQVDERSRVIGWDESLSGPIIHNPVMNVRAIIKPAGSFKRIDTVSQQDKLSRLIAHAPSSRDQS